MYLLMLGFCAWWFSYPGRLYKNTSLGMGLSITSKLEGECLGGCGVVVAQWSEHWRLKPEALGSIPGGYPDVFSSSKLLI